MDFFDCIFSRRSCRRFKQEAVPREDLDRMVDAGRYAPTGFNKPGLRFAIVHSPKKVDEAFQFTGWLTGKPPEGQRPTAYIVVLIDNNVGGGMPGVYCATYAVMLAARALGYGSCWHGCADGERAQRMKTFLDLPDHVQPGVMISLGRPDESFIVHDPSDQWQVRKTDDGPVHLGKPSRDTVTLRVL